jgi:hypothetical protein
MRQQVQLIIGTPAAAGAGGVHFGFSLWCLRIAHFTYYRCNADLGYSVSNYRQSNKLPKGKCNANLYIPMLKRIVMFVF